MTLAEQVRDKGALSIENVLKRADVNLCHFSSPVGCGDSTVEKLAGRVTPSRCTSGEQAPC